MDNMKIDIDNLEKDVASIKKRNQSTTVRGAMRALENSICYEACGSKNKYKKYFSFEQMQQCQEPAVLTKWQEILSRLKLTSEHLIEIDYLKDGCDRSWHPVLTVEDWRKAVMHEGLGAGDFLNRDVLLSALRCYFPVAREHELWPIHFSPLTV
jgi:hypothetical protein